MFEGEGTGDDRRLNLLIKNFCQWSNSFGNDSVSKEWQDLLYQRMLALISEAEISMKKSDIVKQACNAEQKEYDHIYDRIDINIDEAKSVLDALKNQLVEAKAERKNKSEANAVCDLIQQFPSRSQTNDKLAEVNNDVRLLERQTVELKLRIENWIKQFDDVIKAVHEMNSLLEQDVEGDIYKNQEDMEVDNKIETID